MLDSDNDVSTVWGGMNLKTLNQPDQLDYDSEAFYISKLQH